MCTLTYLPTSKGYIFTHNRDERMDRPTSSEFQIRKVNGQNVYFPQDLEAHGSWIAFSDKGVSACLLNGGSTAHIRKAKYRKSRGLVVLESFEYQSILDFHNGYNFENIEPFTLLIHDGNELHKIVHNETATLLERQNLQTENIWSSTTLYTPEVREKRQKWFNHWLDEKPVINPDNIRAFHGNAGDGDTENDLVMSRWGILKTLSLTQISIEEGRCQLLYQDFVQQSKDQRSIVLP